MPLMGMMVLCGATGQGMMDSRQMKDMRQGMMTGTLPPGTEPHNFPEPESQGASVLSTSCAQCHNLPSPRMYSTDDGTPPSWTTGTGADVMKRVAVPMIGGMVSSTILTLLVIPVLSALWRGWTMSSGVPPLLTGTDLSLQEQKDISVSGSRNS